MPAPEITQRDLDLHDNLIHTTRKMEARSPMSLSARLDRLGTGRFQLGALLWLCGCGCGAIFHFMMEFYEHRF